MASTSVYSIKRIALHFIDREQDTPDFGMQEVDLRSIESEGNKDALDEFFDKHLEKVWNQLEGAQTVSASFKEDSALQKIYQGIRGNEEIFFESSCEIAQLLHESSKGRRATPGLLMVIWLLAEDYDQPFLALFKMALAPNKVLALKQGANKGDVLLDIAVETVEQALPEPGDRILKWAVVPHPIRPVYDLKIQDTSSNPIAQYFMDFLGCVSKPSEKKQRLNLLAAVSTYASEAHGDDGQRIVNDVLSTAEEASAVTPDTIVATFAERGDGFNEGLLRQKFAEADVEDFYISGMSLKKTRLEYRIVGQKITIEGPRQLMEEQVELVEEGNETVFRIRTRTSEIRKSYK